MDPDDVISVALADSFQPFRVHTRDGRTIDVRTQGAVFVGRSRLTLRTQSCKIPDAKGPWYHIPYAELLSLQPIVPPSARNGERQAGNE